MLTISVSDTGCGITEEDKKRLFQEFSCLKSNKKMNPNGVGLGLFISMKIIRNLFGDIWVDSVLGEGSTFSFKIPIGYKIENLDEDMEEEKEDRIVEPLPAKEDRLLWPLPAKEDRSTDPMPPTKARRSDLLPTKKDELLGPLPAKEDELLRPLRAKEDGLMEFLRA